jgi:hypothetical protein
MEGRAHFSDRRLTSPPDALPQRRIASGRDESSDADQKSARSSPSSGDARPRGTRLSRAARKDRLMKPIFLLWLAIPAAFAAATGCGGESSLDLSNAGRNAGAGTGGTAGRGGSTGSGGSSARGGTSSTGGTTSTGGTGTGGSSAGRGGQAAAGSSGSGGRGGDTGDAGARPDSGAPGIAGSTPMPMGGRPGMPGAGGHAAEEECPEVAPAPMSECEQTRPRLRCEYAGQECRCMGGLWMCEAAQPECPETQPVAGAMCDRREGPGGRCRYEEADCDCTEEDGWRCRERPEPPAPPGAGGAPDGPMGPAGAPG